MDKLGGFAAVRDGKAGAGVFVMANGLPDVHSLRVLYLNKKHVR